MVIEVREEQSEKALSPIVVTLLGMVIEVREQPEKAEEPIDVTPLPIITCLTLLRYCDHGLAYLSFQLYISPVPVMVNTPSAVKVSILDSYRKFQISRHKLINLRPGLSAKDKVVSYKFFN